MRKVTILIPLFREKTRLERSAAKIAEFVRGCSGFEFSVLLVDDGSGDGTAELARELACRWSLPGAKVLALDENRGKGAAVKAGVMAADGDLVLMSDCDLSAPLEEFVHLLKAVDDGAHFAFGSRKLGASSMELPPPLHRRLLSRFFHFAVWLTGVRDFKDTQCGFKLFKTDAARRVFSGMRINRFAFDVELILRARSLGLRVDEVAVKWNYSPESTVRVFSSGAGMLRDLLRIAWWRLIGEL
jgi:dolichyl-phosphate beta-glucosyltransferase